MQVSCPPMLLAFASEVVSGVPLCRSFFRHDVLLLQSPALHYLAAFMMPSNVCTGCRQVHLLHRSLSSIAPFRRRHAPIFIIIHINMFMALQAHNPRYICSRRDVRLFMVGPIPSLAVVLQVQVSHLLDMELFLSSLLLSVLAYLLGHLPMLDHR